MGDLLVRTLRLVILHLLYLLHLFLDTNDTIQLGLSAFELDFGDIKDVGAPLADGNLLLEEQGEFQVGAAGGLANVEPSIGDGQAGGASVDEAQHGAQIGGIVEVGGREGGEPDGEVEDDDGHGQDLVLIGSDRHLSRNGVGQRTRAEVVGADDKVGEDDNDILAGLGDVLFGADAADHKEGQDHDGARDDQVGPAPDLVAQDDGGAHGEDLEDVGDQADDEGFLNANGLGENDAVDVEEDDAIDL